MTLPCSKIDDNQDGHDDDASKEVDYGYDDYNQHFDCCTKPSILEKHSSLNLTLVPYSNQNDNQDEHDNGANEKVDYGYDEPANRRFLVKITPPRRRASINSRKVPMSQHHGGPLSQC
jgi:hypothetical protein